MSTPLENVEELLKKREGLEKILQELKNKSECPCGYNLFGLRHKDECTEKTGKVVLEEMDYIKTIRALTSLRKLDKDLALLLGCL